MITMPGETAGVTTPEIHGSRFSTGTAQKTFLMRNWFHRTQYRASSSMKKCVWISAEFCFSWCDERATTHTVNAFSITVTSTYPMWENFGSSDIKTLSQQNLQSSSVLEAQFVCVCVHTMTHQRMSSFFYWFNCGFIFCRKQKLACHQAGSDWASVSDAAVVKRHLVPFSSCHFILTHAKSGLGFVSGCSASCRVCAPRETKFK